jgi:hypothetical protein
MYNPRVIAIALILFLVTGYPLLVSQVKMNSETESICWVLFGVFLLFFGIFPSILVLAHGYSTTDEAKQLRRIGRRYFLLGALTVAPAGLACLFLSYLVSKISEAIGMGGVIVGVGLLVLSLGWLYVGFLVWVTGIDIPKELKKNPQLKEKYFPNDPS